jgi:hypothetical protein
VKLSIVSGASSLKQMSKGRPSQVHRRPARMSFSQIEMHRDLVLGENAEEEPKPPGGGE